MNEYGTKRYPDYTEMAYKEAVSKLRYFLSGNYAPSLRSYGGSASIKNLEESDAETTIDTNKPYQTSVYGTPADYRTKVRPLMSRYLNMYGDTFKHYGSSANNMQNTTNTTAGVTVSPSAERPPTVAAPPSDPNVMNFVHKQEEYIEQLERESSYCRDELNNLLVKVKEVISENDSLHEAQKNKLISRAFRYGGAASESDEDEVHDSTGVDSDAKLSPRKYKSNSAGSGLHGPNIVFESRIAELEAQLMQANIHLKKVQEENGENKRRLSEGLVDSSCIDSFKRQIENLQRDKGSLEVQVDKLKCSLEEHKRCGVDADVINKMKAGNESLEQQLRDERNNLETELRRVKDELSAERGKLRSVTGEGARRALQERDLAQRRYGQHLEEMSHDLAAQYDAVGKLQLELERQRRDESDLKRELSMKSTALEDLRMDFKNKTASLQADLAQAQAEKASLEEEIVNARLSLERVQRQAKHDTNRLNSEISSLRSRLERADADLVHARRENLRLAEQVANSEKELNMQNLCAESPTKDKDKQLSDILQSMENKHAHTVGELEAMIQSQNVLMDKLTGECRTLTYKLDDASRRHKLEMATLQRKVESLSESIHPAQPTNTSHIQDDNGVFEPTEGFTKPGADTTELSDVAGVHGNPHDSPKHDRNQDQSVTGSSSEDALQKSARKPSAQIPPDKPYEENIALSKISEPQIDNTNNTVGQEYETQDSHYGAQGQVYVAQGQGHDAQEHGLNAQVDNYNTQSQNYDTQGQDYAIQDQVYATQGQDYATQGQDYATQGQDYPTQGEDYAAQGQDYATQGQDYAAQGQDYATQGQDYATQGQDYATHGQDYATQGQDYATQGQDYATHGQDYGEQGQVYDTQGQDYDHGKQEYTEEQHYQAEQSYGNETEAYKSETAPIGENAYSSKTDANSYPPENYEGQDKEFIPNETYPEDQYQQPYSEQQYDPNAQYAGAEGQNYATEQYNEPTEDNREAQYVDNTADLSKQQDLAVNNVRDNVTSDTNRERPIEANGRNNSPTKPTPKSLPKKKKSIDTLKK